MLFIDILQPKPYSKVREPSGCMLESLIQSYMLLSCLQERMAESLMTLDLGFRVVSWGILAL